MPLRLLVLHRLIRAIMVVMVLAYANSVPAQVTSIQISTEIRRRTGRSLIPMGLLT